MFYAVNARMFSACANRSGAHMHARMLTGRAQQNAITGRV